MTVTVEDLWQNAFLETSRQQKMGSTLQQAALCGALSNWTKALTEAVVLACQSLSWKASAKGHSIDLLPVSTQEFLALDVTAFAQAAKPYQFPIAVMELENQTSRVAYSLWKVLSTYPTNTILCCFTDFLAQQIHSFSNSGINSCIRTQLRVVFGYSDTGAERAKLIRTLRDKVLDRMESSDRLAISGETLIVVGSRDDAESFPYGYFKWWKLEKSTGKFLVI